MGQETGQGPLLHELAVVAEVVSPYSPLDQVFDHPRGLPRER